MVELSGQRRFPSDRLALRLPEIELTPRQGNLVQFPWVQSLRKNETESSSVTPSTSGPMGMDGDNDGSSSIVRMLRGS